jgi:hypothetical protein
MTFPRNRGEREREREKLLRDQFVYFGLRSVQPLIIDPGFYTVKQVLVKVGLTG